MANSRRVEKLAALLKREISELLVNGIRDDRIHQAMITITSVEVSGDLQHARIFISLFGEEKKKDEVLVGLEEAKGFIRAELAQRLPAVERACSPGLRAEMRSWRGAEQRAFALRGLWPPTWLSVRRRGWWHSSRPVDVPTEQAAPRRFGSRCFHRRWLSF